jgi:alkylation response protein AidB-like acyl-CoA dehydrogenase
MAPPRVLAEQLVPRAQRLADELLRPAAEQVDRTAVPRSHLDAWAAEGLLGLAGPRAYGGAQAPADVQREVAAVMAGACGSTWFVAAQHALPVTALAASPNEALRERRLAALCTGALLSGVAFSHLRRPGPPAVLATRVDGGWRFDGDVPWMTGWGLCDVVLLAGRTVGDEVVWVLVEAREGAGLSASEPLALAAMGATRTVTLALDGLQVPDADVVEVGSAADWLAADALRTANATPNVFGLQRECVRRLAETASARDDGTAAALAHALGQEGVRLRRVAETLLDDVPPEELVEDRLAVRASALELALRSATALVAATGGSAMSLDAAPQRLAREAVFLLVQAQTPPLREALLQLWRDSGA